MAMQRGWQLVSVGSMMILSWLGMMLVHEFGHVCAAVLTGGQVQRVIFHPLTFSQTQVDPNPAPGRVVWAGPVLGSLLPPVLWLIARAARWAWSHLLAFFAGFCLIANGVYIGIGSFAGVADAGEMVRLGAPIWTLWLFGLFATAAGLWIWHKVSPKYGFGPEPESLRPRVALMLLAAALAAIVLGTVFGDRGG